MLSQIDKKILSNHDFQKLVTVRRLVSWSFLLILLALYLAYGLMSIHVPEVLAMPVFSEGIMPVGIAMGYGILAMTFLATLIYVRIANNYFAPLEKKIIADIKAGQ